MSKLQPVRSALRPPTRERSRLMARVRRTGTAPELALRKTLYRAGLRYRLDGGVGLPGTPDIAFKRLRLAIFVDGCFWHGCPTHGTISKTNTSFWTAKIARNRERDGQVNESLKRLGWKVLRLWEHEVRSEMDHVLRRIKRLTNAR